MANKIHLRNRSIIQNVDWVCVLIYIALLAVGWINIYSASLPFELPESFDLSQAYNKQLLFISLCVPVIIVILSLKSNFYETFSVVFYGLGIVALAGLFIFGATKKGQTNWYNFGSFSVQPSEFMKIGTLLFLAKFTDETQTKFSTFKEQFKGFMILAIPMFLISLQPDIGTVIVFLSFLFVMHREGLSSLYLWAGLIGAVCFLSALILPIYIVISIVALGCFFHFYYTKKSIRNPLIHILIFLVATGFTFSVDYVFNNILEPHQKARINVLLGINVNLKKEGYNLNQSKIAIGSGNWFGKGWLEGTQTKGGFVPEQHTDYIFTTIGEEWGFFGSTFVIGLFITLLLRIIYLAEQQKNTFSRVYGYGVVAILFTHFFLNISMLVGLFPTIGIPLPLISYGGSSLIAFTILIFIFIRLDANKINEW